MFDSNTRSLGDLAGVFEFDGETGYFYLYQIDMDCGNKILGAMQIISGNPSFCETDISIQWDTDERMVGLVIKQNLWAVFDSQDRAKFGGNYQTNAEPKIPLEISGKFVGRGKTDSPTGNA